MLPSFLGSISLASEEIEKSYQDVKENEELDEKQEEIEEEEKKIEEKPEEEEKQDKEEANKEKEEKEKEEANKETEEKEKQEETDLKEEKVEELEIQETNTRLTKAIPNGTTQLPEGEGVYVISTALGNDKVIDIAGGSMDNFANVQLWRNANVKQQKFEITYNKELNAYTIKAIHSNKVLDVANGGSSNGTNVQQYESNGTVAQQWILEEAGEGYFYLVSKCNGLYLDVNYSVAENGANIQVYEGNHTKAQKFKFTKIPELISAKLPEGDGIYHIVTALDNNKVLEVSEGSYYNFANIQLWNDSKAQQKRFEIKYNEASKSYTIIAAHSGKALDVANGATTNGTNVQQYDSNYTQAQQWIFEKAQDGYFYIISKCNGLYLDVNNSVAENGTNIQVYEGNKTKAQKFKFVKDEENKSEKTLKDGIYQIHTRVDENKILQVNSTSQNLQIVNQSKIINNNNKFRITYLQNGYYTMKVLNNEQNLTVENGWNTNGTKIKMQKQDNSSKQEWIIKHTANGYFNIVGRCNGLYLDIPFGSANVGMELQMYEGNRSKAQEFKFEEVDERPLQSERLLEDGAYYIQSALDLNKVLDVSEGSNDNYANIQIWRDAGVQQQKFEVTYNSKGKYYQMVSVKSGKSLDVQGNARENKTNVQQYEKNNTTAQHWILQEAGNGYFYIIAKGAEMYLDINGASTNNGTNVQLYEGNGSTAQKFKFKKTTMIEEETYKIAIRNDYNKYFDISGGSLNEGANLQIWQDSNVNQQVFRVEFDADKTYCKITAKHSNQVLTVEANNNVVQRTDMGADNQRWSLEVVGYGYYKIKSKANGLYLDVDLDSTINGTNIKVYEGYNGNAQKFYFSGVKTLDGVDVSEWQGLINWEFVRRAGTDFAIIRVGYGQHSHQKDKWFEENYKAAKVAGLKVGVYLYSYAQSVEDARREAYNCLNWLEGRHLDYPVFYDIEDPSQGRIEPQTMTDMVNTFCGIISNAGYKTGVYTYRDWFRSRIYTNQLPGHYQIWLAHYTWDVNKPSDYEGYYNIWQYTSRGYVPGINGNADRNIEYRNY